VDLSICSTEPFSRFHDFHEEFNRAIKVTYGALLRLQEHCEETTELISLPIEDEPWGIPWPVATAAEKKTVWHDPTNDIEFAKLFLAEMGIVRAFSAFEDLLTSVQAEYDRTRFLRDDPEVALTNSEYDAKPVAMCRRLNWKTEPIAFALPLFDYFLRGS
jgi:hypothetical protein